MKHKKGYDEEDLDDEEKKKRAAGGEPISEEDRDDRPFEEIRREGEKKFYPDPPVEEDPKK